LRTQGPEIWADGLLVAKGTRQTLETVEADYEDAKRRLGDELGRFAVNTLEYLQDERDTVPGLSTKSFCLVTVLGRCWRLRRWIGLSNESPISDPAVLGLPW